MKEFKLNERSIIDRGDVCVGAYLRDLNKYVTISAEEEADLARQIKKGGRDGELAKKRLIEANLRFVVSVANQFKQKHMELADLISEGNIGLIKAAETFDESRGFKFISYAVWWIRQSIMAAIDNLCTTLRLPSNQLRILQAYREMDRDMVQLEQRHMTIDEFCEETGVKKDMMENIMGACKKPVKMDEPLDCDSDSTFGDMIASANKTDDNMDKGALREDLYVAIRKCLKERDADIVCQYYGLDGEPSTLARVAEKHDLSIERTRQICLNAMKKIRQSPYSTYLAAYLAAEGRFFFLQVFYDLIKDSVERNT